MDYDVFLPVNLKKKKEAYGLLNFYFSNKNLKDLNSAVFTRVTILTREKRLNVFIKE